MKNELIMNKGLSRDDAKEMDKRLGQMTHIRSDSVTAGGRIEDCQIDIRIGIGGVEEAAKTDRFRAAPKFKDAVDIDEVIKECAVFMPAFTGAD